VGGLHYQLSALEAGKAYLNVGMLPEAERHLRFAIQIQRLWTYPNLLPSFLSYTLAHFYLAELYERTGRKAEAITAYEEFLGHFETPPSKLPQIAEAHAALIRLGAQ
jgi:tetratricopeptide (TPR) repeat protein